MENPEENKNQIENKQSTVESFNKLEIDPVEVENLKIKQEISKKEDIEKVHKLEDVLHQKFDESKLEIKDNELEKVQKYHNDLKFGAGYRLDRLPKDKVSTFFDKLQGNSKMYKIMQFIGEQNTNSEIELSTILKDEKNTKSELDGINKISNFELDNGNMGYVVHIDKDKWSFSGYGPGVAISGANIAFVIDGLSKRSDRLIEDHEKYHLNNPDASEWQTVLNANLKKDFIGSGLVVLQSLLQYPKWIRNSFTKSKI